MKRIGIVIVTVGMSLGAAAAEKAATKTVKAVGRSAQSREHAVKLALREALQRGAGMWISSRMEVADAALIRDSIYTRTKGYIADYTVLGAEWEGDIHAVTVRAVVAVGKLRDDWVALQHLVELAGRPDFVVEVDAGDRDRNAERIAWIRGKMNDRLERLGLRVRYRPVEKKAAMREYIQAVNSKDMNRAKAIKTKLGAPYGIYVRAFGKLKDDRAFDIPLQTADVSLQGTVVSRSTAGILASRSSTAAAADRDGTRAMKKACEKAAGELFDACLERIIANWARQIDVGVKVALEATALTYAELAGLKKHLAGVKGVECVKIVENDPAGLSIAEIRGMVSAAIVADAVLAYRDGRYEPWIIGPGRVGCRKAGADGQGRER